jgi:carbon monoxide dehydrogenase subunit G
VELSHSFTVPADVETTWATFMDLEEVGGCFPGATVTEVGDEGFAGTVKVKLGPIALVYAGTGAFVERDDAAHRAVIEAKGKDKRGNGTAGATVSIQLSDAGDGSTRADVRTDLAVTGKPAQFGRGVMQDVSDKLLGQFIGCIEGKLSPAAREEAPPPAATEPAPPPAATEPDVAPLPQPAAVEPDVAPPPQRAARPAPAARDDALDLGSTVLPVLLRSYGKKVAAAVAVVVVVVVVWRLLSR